MSFKVLIVEDDPMVAMINEQYVLKNPQFTVAATCRNGQEAVTYLENPENLVDLILLDVYMPVMDGIETLKKIRQLKINTEVIMVTAANDTTTIQNTMNLGVVDYLIKPFSLDRFNVSLEKFANKKQMFTQNQVLDQKNLDALISSGMQNMTGTKNFGTENLPASRQPASPESEKLLPKGIQKRTLTLITEYFEKNPSWHTVDIVAADLGISIVTVRNYLNYLVKEKLITEDINYSTGGRPSMLYKKSE